MKNSKFRKVITGLIVVIIMITSIGMIVAYPTIDKIAKEKQNKYSYFESYDFINILKGVSYKSFYDILQKNQTELESPFDVLVKDNSEGRRDEHAVDFFNDTVENYMHNYLNIDYYAISSKDEINITNIEGIEILENADIDINSIKNDHYQFYVVINYDDLGRPTVKYAYGANQNTIQQELYKNSNSVFYGYHQDLISIKNTNFVIGVPKELNYYDNVSWKLDNFLNNSYGEASTIFIVIGIVVVILTAFLIPYDKEKEIVGFRVISKIPFEIILILLGLNSFLTVTSSMYMINECVTGVPSSFIGRLTGNLPLNHEVYYFINVIIWIVIFTVYFNAGLMLKHIFKFGWKKYFFESTFIGRFVGFVSRCIKRTIRTLGEVDFTKKNNKTILKIILINGVILSLLCLTWFFGVIGVAIYSVVIFLLIRKYVDRISNKYKVLTDATKKIAEGCLDVKIEEDLGVFEPLKDDLERIQSGFKRAVEEEVKSEKMKTELISNVSHDLKTPLTSIITYIDLLKDEKLTKEKRVGYLDTLDRKAERLQYLIEDLFEVSKATSGNITMNIEAVDVVSLMKQTLLELEDNIQGALLNMRNNFPEEKVVLQLDSFRTFRVFENLVSNITKYAMPNTRVYIDIINKNDYVEIILKNMAAEEIKFDVDNISERFVRGDESRNTEGSGLGLAIAKSFVELQGGSLKIEVDGDLFKVIIKFQK
ncbi:MAG: sensor histidine kinase [Clostridium sp.]|nr:sensor histidine kinase [Clostridium sp.]